MSDELITSRDLIMELREDMKKMLDLSSRNDERMRAGVAHFAKIDAEIQTIQARKCPSFPRPSIVYPLIVVGFTLLGFLVSIKG